MKTDRNNVADLYPLSPLQEGLLFHSLLEPGSEAYTEQLSATVVGELDAVALKAAWKRLVADHAVLRSAIEWEIRETPFQVVLREVELPWRHHDWRAMGEGALRDRLDALRRTERSAAFDLSRPPLLRLALVCTGDRRHEMVWTFHHIVLDGWSVALLLDRLLALYRAGIEGREPEPVTGPDFKEYVRWIGSRGTAGAGPFWRRCLAGVTAPTPLPAARPGGPPVDGSGREPDEHRLALTARETADLHAFAQRSRVTIGTVILGGWALALARSTGRDDVVFGNTVSGRGGDLRGIESVVGLLINTLPARVRMAPGRDLGDWLRELQAEQAEARQHEHTPLVRVQEWSDIAPGVPLFHTLLAFENYPSEEILAERASASAGLEVVSVRIVEQPHYPLALVVAPGERLSLRLVRDPGRVEGAAARRLLGRVARLLAQVASGEGRRLGDLDALEPWEHHRVLTEWADGGGQGELDAPVHRMVGERASLAPDAIAVVSAGGCLSYRELVRRAEGLAKHLRSMGVGTDDTVGILAGRTPAMVVGALGVLEAGAAYLPLDPAHPPARLRAILDDARPAALLVEEGREGTPAVAGREVSTLTGDRSPEDDRAGAGERVETPLESAAYVVYTSGSSGRPKGVVLRHAGLTSLVRWHQESYELTAADHSAHTAGLGFDASVWELWPPLASGGSLHLSEAADRESPERLTAWLARERITVAFLVTPLAEAMLGAGEAAGLALRFLLTGGDRLGRRPPAGSPFVLVNHYGPTEGTVVATADTVAATGDGAPPIGRPIGGVRAYLASRSAELVPVAAEGEIWIGGRALARGYLGDPSLTAAVFVPDPWSGVPGSRLYRTGDLARHRDDGRLEFLGRIDQQIEVRGVRVEPGEIEQALLAHPAVGAAVVVQVDGGDTGRLVAYVVPPPGTAEPSPAELSSFLLDRLPAAMMPAVFVTLDDMPMTANGKVDRRRLPAPEGTETGSDVRPASPRTQVERLVAAAWEQVLGTGPVGLGDDFFALGGHSLKATRIVSRVRSSFGVEMPVRTLFEERTVAGLAAWIEERLRAGARPAGPPLERLAHGGEAPLSYSQQRLWFLDRLQPDSPVYNIPLAVRIDGDLRLAVLDAALTREVQRQESLHTTFADREGEPVQVLIPRTDLELPVVDLSALPVGAREAEAGSLLAAEASRTFDLLGGAPARALLLRTGERQHILLLTLHHIVADGWSMTVLMRDLVALYRAFADGRPSPLPRLEIQYRDYAVWQRRWLAAGALDRQLAHWRRRMEGAPPSLDLPADRPRPPVQDLAGARQPFRLGPGPTEALRAFCRAEGATPFIAVLAAFEALLSRTTGAEDVVVGSLVANRTRAETEELIGFFVNTQVLRTDLSGDPGFRQLVRRVRSTVLEAFSHQDLPFEELVAALAPPRDLSRTPLFQIAFTLQESAVGGLELPGVSFSPVEVTGATSRFDLGIDLVEEPDVITGAFEYATALFDRTTVARLAGRLATVLGNALADPRQRLSELEILSRAERQQIAHEWNDTDAPGNLDFCLHEILEELANDHPDRVAIELAGGPSSYGELDRRANRLARHLRSRGVGRGVRVGLSVGRSLEMLVGLWAIFKSGGVYVPLDPSYPAERLAHIVEDSRIRLLLTHGDRQLPATAAVGTEVVRMEDLTGELAALPDHAPVTRVDPWDLAYVIYTSGSSGTPKGVLVSHRGLANLVCAQRTAFGLGPGSRVLQLASLSFDFSLMEIALPLSSGGRSIVAAEDTLTGEQGLEGFLADHAVDTAVVPPTLLSAVSADRLPGLATLAVGGEAVGAEVVARWAPGRRFYNVYGPTESTVWTHVSPWSDGSRRPPIGRPIENVRTYTVDRSLRVLPAGVPGELVIGGEVLAWGYLHRTALTAERFVPDPTSHRPGARVYRTGDLVRFLPDGELDFLGRIDHQVKVRGFRIEPGEIETVLSRHPSVLETVVLAHEDGHRGRRLVAYLAVDRPERLDPAELRALVREHLPEHMMPSVFVPLATMPRTPNGKIDREALAAAATPAPAAGTGVSPRTADERILVRVWEEVLGCDRVGVDQNFFELGGDSILSLRVVARAAEAGLAITARHVFEHQTVAELARVAAPVANAADQAPLVGSVPLTPIQRWFFERDLEAPHHWNQALMLEAAEGLRPAVVAQALAHLADRHDALRLRFHRDEGGVRQVAEPPGTAAFALTRIDLSGVAAELRPRAVERAAEALQSSFDLERGPICGAAWFDPEPGQPARLLLAVHHLAIDAVSWRMLFEDLETACGALLGGDPVRLPPRTTSLRGWAERLEENAAAPETLAELDFWSAPERREASPVRRDQTGGRNRVGSSDSVTVSFGADTALLLDDVRRDAHAPMEELLLAALAHGFGRVLGRGLLAVDVESHGREEISGANTSRTVGWFTALYPVLLDTRASDPRAALRGVKERFRKVPRRGIGYGLLRYLTPDPAVRARLDALPSAEVSFNYLGRLDSGDQEGAALLGPSVEPTGPVQGAANRRHHLIEVGAVVVDGDLELTLRYGREIHRRDTVEALAEEMLACLRSFVHSARAGTLSVPAPSDFSLAGLGTAELDRLIETHGRIDDVYPLSPLQQGLLFHSRLESGAGEYVVQMGCRLAGELDAASLERAWQLALDRHSALRTAFVGWELDTGPRQVVLRRVELPFETADWRGLAENERAVRWSARLADDRRAGFDVERAPLLRLFLARVGKREHRLLATFHHLLLDGWSLARLVSEVMEDYETLRGGGSPARPAPRPYRDYVAWLARQETARAEAYWRGALAGFSSPTPLPRPRAGGAALHRDPGGEHSVTIPRAASKALRAAAARHRLTLATLLEGAFALLLGRLSGEPEVVFGVTTSGRPAELPGAESIVGLFVNSLPARVPLPDGEPLLAWLRAVQARQAELRQHEATPLVAVHGWSEVPRDRPLFESLFVYESYPTPTALTTAPGGLEVREIEVAERTHYPLTVVVAPGDEIHVKLLFAGDRFDAAGALRLVRRLRDLAERLPSLLEEPEATLADLDSLGAGERHQVLHEWNDTRADYPADTPVHTLFEERAARHPDAVALVTGAAALTYGELDRRATDLARRLRARGVGPEARVGLLLERSARTVVAILGVLKAGGAYVPLDPEWPEARLALVLDQVPVALIVTDESSGGDLPERSEPVLRLDERGPEAPGAEPPARVSSDHLAYVLFTSGSTGTPKGVAVCHRSIVRLILGARYVDLRPDDVFLHFAPLGFDASTFEIWGALLTGGRLVVAPPDGPSLAALGDDLVRHRVTVLWLTAGLFHLMIEERPDTLAGVRELLAGGDVLSAEHVRRALAARRDGRVINGYGPTECTTFTCCHSMRDPEAADGSVSIGRPIANTRVHLLGDGARPVPTDSEGELHVGGPGLARGYLGDAALTAEKFVPDPFAATPGGRLYRTGDLARYRADGLIEFLGRRDLLVKVRGFRVEPGEVESALGRHPSVRESVVVPHRGGPGGALLVAYVVGEPGAEPSAGALRESLEAWLPGYMVPSAFVLLDELPLDANGKVDRRSLPVPELAGEADFVTARTPTEELLTNLWREVLDVERIGVHDRFFDLGGHSLLAARLLARTREAFGVQVPIRALFERPTVAGLAAIVDEARRDGVIGLPPIARVPRDVDLMLSFSQERLWFLDQLEPGSPLYNIPVALRFAGGRPDLPALRRALAWVVGRHEALRTTFEESGGRPRQRISEVSGWKLPLVDLSGLEPGEREAEARRLAGREALEPFELGRFPLLRTHLLRLTGEEHVLLVVIHHIVADGGSMHVLVDELAAGYRAFAAGGRPERAAPVVQYPDFAQWQRRHLRGDALQRLLAYWRDRLEGAPAMLELATDRPRPARQRFRGAARDVELPAGLVEGLDRFAGSTGTTAFMVLLAAFQGLLSRYSGQRDFVVGTPVANRSRPETQSLIGFFVNTLALRADLENQPGFGALVRRVRESVLDAFAHEDLPFETLVEEIRPERDLSHMPLLQVLFAFRQETDDGARELPGLTLEPVAVPAATAKFDLTLELVLSDRQAYGRWEYDIDLFDATTIRRMAGAFETFLAGALESPERPFTELPVLSRAERHQVAHEWNDTGGAYPEELAFHERFVEHARRCPDAVALDFEDRAITYGELDQRSDRLARHLRRLGVRPGSRVGIGLERSPELGVAILGILKAGSAYLPLDPAYPQVRLELMVDDARLAALVSQESLIDTFPEPDGPVVSLDYDRDAISREPAEPCGVPTAPESPAYLIYTSGSTGRPKGALLTHRGMSNLVEAQAQEFGLSPTDRVLQFAALSFDASVFDFAMALGSGATLQLAPDEILLPGPDLIDFLRRRRVGHVTLPPSALEVLPGDELPDLRRLVVAGEVCSPELASRWSEGRRFWNAYGPTEATIWSTVFECGPESRRPPIGRPILNSAARVLDGRLEAVPIGVPGELYLAGAGLSLGYLHRPALTAERFLPDPGNGVPGARLYRTGDRVRHLGDGELDFLGRIDDQVKVRGFRIELGEIESALEQHAKVAKAIALLRAPAGGHERLVAYVVPERPDADRSATAGRPAGPDDAPVLETAELAFFLRQRLPGFMMPQGFVLLDSLPLTPSGKVDRGALPAPEDSRSGRLVAPRTVVEEVLAGIWADLLKLDEVGVYDNFFELGGHSLIATQMVSRVREAFQIELPLRGLFEAATVAALAEKVEEALGVDQEVAVPPIRPVPREGGARLSYPQQRLWFLDQLEPGSAAYAVLSILRMEGALEVTALAGAMAEIVRRHEILRTNFVFEGDEPRQVVSPPGAWSLPLVDLSGLPVAVRPEEVRRLARREGRRPFDLARERLLRMTLLALGAEEHVALLNMHHIVSDGWSTDVLAAELAVAYRSLAEGRAVELPELPVQYGDYAEWQRSWLSGETLEAHLRYWVEKLAGRPALPAGIPPDRPRPRHPTRRGDRIVFTVGEETTKALEELCRREGATLFMVLLAALDVLVYRSTGEEDVLVGAHVANRSRAEIEGLIGFFVNILVLRNDLADGLTFRECLRRVRQTTLEAYAHQDLPYDRLVEELQPRRDASHNPLFQVAFNFIGRSRAEEAEAGDDGGEAPFRVTVVEPEESRVRFDFMLAMSQGVDRLSGSWEYATELYDRSTAERVHRRYLALLDAIAVQPDALLDELDLLDLEAASADGAAPGDGLGDRAEEYERFRTVRPKKMWVGGA